MKNIWMLLIIGVLMLTACGPTPEPTMSPADVQGTAMAAAMTMVSETQAAIPTATPIPPTDTPTETPLPTNTVPPLSLETATQAQVVSVFPTNTQASSASGSNDACNGPLIDYAGESATLKITNNTKPKGPLTISLYADTLMGECGYLSASFEGSGRMTIPLGNFTACAIVNSKKPFTACTTFRITGSGNYQLIIAQESIKFTAGCTPNC